MLGILLLAVIMVAIIDLSGFTDSWKSALKKMLTRGQFCSPEYSFKPFDCSFCMTFWSGLVYLSVTAQFSLAMVAYLLVVAFLTPVIKDALVLVRDMVLFLIGIGNRLINK